VQQQSRLSQQHLISDQNDDDDDDDIDQNNQNTDRNSEITNR